MFLRGQRLLNVSMVCALAAGASAANLAQGQCCCRHGGGMGMGGSMANPAVLQMLMQQFLQQQRLLQHVQQIQQQKMLQAKILQAEVRKLAGQGPAALKAALKAPQAEKRWAAALVVGEHGPALTDDLIALLTDDNAFVRQAARRGLVRLSITMGKRERKSGKGRRVDFGPAPGSNRVAQRRAARKWRSWFELQQKTVVNLKGFVPPKTVAAPPGKVVTTKRSRVRQRD